MYFAKLAGSQSGAGKNRVTPSSGGAGKRVTPHRGFFRARGSRPAVTYMVIQFKLTTPSNGFVDCDLALNKLVMLSC